MKSLTPQRQQGSARFTIFLFMIMLACFWYGGQGAYTALRNRKPVVLDYSDLSKGKPTAQWLTLKNCEFDLSEAAFKITKTKYSSSSGGFVTEAYLPLHAAGAPEDAPSYAVLATKDPDIILVVDSLRRARNAEEFTIAAAKVNQGVMRQKRDVSGLVRFGIEDSESGKLAGMKQHLAKDFILLAEGQQPKLGQSVGFVFLGFVIAGGLVLAWRSGRETTTEDV